MNSQALVNATLHDKINNRFPTENNPRGRFMPTEKPRSVVEKIKPQSKQLASEVGFSPVATVNVQNSSVSVRPVNNTLPRPISPAVLDGNGRVQVRGERVIELGSNLHDQIKAKINSDKLYPKVKTSDGSYTAPHDFSSEQKIDRSESNSSKQALKQQLEEINKVLFEQIKQKIATEITRQKEQVKKPTPIQVAPQTTLPKAPVITETKLPNLGPAVNINPVSQVEPAQKIPSPKTTVTPPKTDQKPLQPVPIMTPAPVANITKPPTLEAKKTLVNPVLTSSTVEYKNHISKLEMEINSLTKEVANLDNSLAQLEQEDRSGELSAMEHKLEVDQRMLQAVAEWRLSLNNLLNSHTVALKYLKQKVGWLETKIAEIDSHSHKHEKLHKKSSSEINLPNFEPGFSELDTITKELPKQVEVALASPIIAKEISQPTITKELPTSTNNSSVIQKPTIELTENQFNQPQSTPFSTNGKVVEQQTVVIKPENATVIERKEEKQVSPQEVQKMVSEALADERKEAELKKIENEKKEKESLKTLLKEAIAESNAATPKPEPDKEAVKSLVNEAIQENPVSTPAPVNVTVVAKEQSGLSSPQTPTITVPTPAIRETDIERQILEAAVMEETSKEVARKTREDEIRKIALEAANKHMEQEAAKTLAPNLQQEVNQAISSVAPEVIKSEFEKIKAGLTQVDNKNLENLTKEQRDEMMHKLNTLEKETLVTKQFDDLKAASERKRINAELQAMLTRLGDKPTSTPATQAANSARPEQKIETLKIQEKQEKTPEQKAKVIAEIKELERQSQARRAASLARPVVKAQPAFGKMLPNTPTIPNVINGIVKDNKGLLLATVVIIVKDKQGDPVRAFKTNKIGQFALSTPVPNGTYILELEKEGYEFDIIEVEVSGVIMQPIEIKAR